MKVHLDVRKISKNVFRFVGKVIWEGLFFYSGCLRHLPPGCNVGFALCRIPLIILGLSSIVLGYWEVTGHMSGMGIMGFLACCFMVPELWQLYRSTVRVMYRLYYTQTVMRRNHFRSIQQSRR